MKKRFFALLIIILILLAGFAFAEEIVETRVKLSKDLKEKGKDTNILEFTEFYYTRGADMAVIKLIPIDACENCFVLASFPVDLASEGEIHYDLLDFPTAGEPVLLIQDLKTNETLINETLINETAINQTPEIEELPVKEQEEIFISGAEGIDIQEENGNIVVVLE